MHSCIEVLNFCIFSAQNVLDGLKLTLLIDRGFALIFKLHLMLRFDGSSTPRDVTLAYKHKPKSMPLGTDQELSQISNVCLTTRCAYNKATKKGKTKLL